MTMTRTLGRSGIEVSALGMGCWAIGGPYWGGTQPYGWGPVDDEESIRTIHKGMDLGVDFFDTASSYGSGHSERVLGRALRGRRDRVVIASKFGNTFDEESKQALGPDASVGYMRSCLDGILHRLDTDYLDLYQFHLGGAEIGTALALIDPLEELVRQGKIRAYGWSTDDPRKAEEFADAGASCAAIQVHLNVIEDNPAMLQVCQAQGQAAINRGPVTKALEPAARSAATTSAVKRRNGCGTLKMAWRHRSGGARSRRCATR